MVTKASWPRRGRCTYGRWPERRKTLGPDYTLALSTLGNLYRAVFKPCSNSRNEIPLMNAPTPPFRSKQHLNQLALDYMISLYLILCATSKGEESLIQHSQKTIYSTRIAGVPGLLSEQVVVYLLANSHP